VRELAIWENSLYLNDAVLLVRVAYSALIAGSHHDPRWLHNKLIYSLMYVCMYVCMYACVCACMYVCMLVCVHVCMYLCMFVCVHVCICTETHMHILKLINYLCNSSLNMLYFFKNI
jgi:hypothetical protein